MKNNVPCKSTGDGSIKIQTNNSIVRTLMNVQLGLKLKKNLISMEKLDDNGYKYSGEGGVLRISKGSFVIIKGKKGSTLYILQSKIVTRAYCNYGIVRRFKLREYSLMTYDTQAYE